MTLNQYFSSIKENLSVKRKIVMITHNDLDGVGCGFILQKYISLNNLQDTVAVDIRNISINEMQNVIQDVIGSYSADPASSHHFDALIISDLFPSRALLMEIAYAQKQLHANAFQYFIYDHHATAIDEAQWANTVYPDYPYENIIVDTSMCGTALLAQALQIDDHDTKEYVNSINAWDIWKWPNLDALEQQKALRLAYLCDNMSPMLLTSSMLTFTIETLTSVKDGPYAEVIVFHEMAKDRELKNALKNGHPITIYANTSDDQIEYNALMLNFPKNVNCGEMAECIFNNSAANAYDVIMFISLDSISLRSRSERIRVNGRPIFNCGKYAKDFGGGGHINAAGFPISGISYDLSTPNNYPIYIHISEY